jgi:lipid II:glycine glycyltransferase (peptidoglycan interpeptide bridge formation enzyme)
MNTLSTHPLQSKKWGDFRRKTGVEVVDVNNGFQMTIHPIPKTSFTIGYIPKCNVPTDDVLEKLVRIGKEKRCIFIKIEPNVIKSPDNEVRNTKYDIRKSSHPLFTQYTFHLDLTQSEGELLKDMKPKTRYNIKIAQKNGVTVKEETSDEAFETYLRLSEETWKRQKFYGHTAKYHRLMWNTLRSDLAHLLIAYYKNEPLTAWIVFLYEDVLYYPYGASSLEHKDVMASNLMMWETIRWGKKHGAKLFDMWGSLGPNPDPNDSWYGFHKFKEGYGGELVEFVGSYDLVLNSLLYRLYTILHPVRQKLLKLSR